MGGKINMKKTIIALSVVFILMFSIGFTVVSAKNQKQKQDKEFNLPKHAVEVSPGVFYLGKAIDKGKLVEGYAFMMKDQRRFAKPETAYSKKIPKKSDTSSCYGFLAKGAKWRTTEDYIVNPSNLDGLNKEFIKNNLIIDISKWENAADGVIDSNFLEILGDGSSTTDPLVADFNAPDNRNEVYFDDLGESNTIAFTVVWGIFKGSPFNRELVEWDMVFNDNYVWSENAKGSTTDMDFENIATHELGHAVGLDDLYTDLCSEQTMYGYSREGDIKKRTLESGDIAGIQKLYN